MTNLSRNKIAVLYHIFYEDTLEYILDEIGHLYSPQTRFFFNISIDNPTRFETMAVLLQAFPDSFVTISSNKGKDIGAKLLLISACLQLEFDPDWLLFLHDKKSLQALNAREWKTGLLKIIEPSQLEMISNIIYHKNGAGLIASPKYVLQELRIGGSFRGNNSQKMQELLDLYKIDCKDWSYIAGTMFWCKADPLLNFFRANNPLLIRQTLEDGNVIDDFQGTHTHAWERMLSWIVTSAGLTIETIK